MRCDMRVASRRAHVVCCHMLQHMLFIYVVCVFWGLFRSEVFLDPTVTELFGGVPTPSVPNSLGAYHPRYLPT